MPRNIPWKRWFVELFEKGCIKTTSCVSALHNFHGLVLPTHCNYWYFTIISKFNELVFVAIYHLFPPPPLNIPSLYFFLLRNCDRGSYYTEGGNEWRKKKKCVHRICSINLFPFSMRERGLKKSTPPPNLHFWICPWRGSRQFWWNLTRNYKNNFVFSWESQKAGGNTTLRHFFLFLSHRIFEVMIVGRGSTVSLFKILRWIFVAYLYVLLPCFL